MTKLSAKREGKVTGSIAGAILGVSPFMTREDAMQQFLGLRQFEGNAATEYGSFHEEYAFADLNLYLNGKAWLNKKNKFWIFEDWLGATPDGFYDEDDAIIEIKCPFSLRDDENPQFKSIDDLPHYYAQLQIEMLCTGCTKAYFFQWNRFQHKLEKVSINPNWFEENLPILQQFLVDVEARKNAMSDDQALEMEYLAAKEAFDEAKAAMDEAKQALIDKAHGEKRKFGSVSVFPRVSKGSVAYAKIVKEKLPDIDLDQYRGEPTTTWIVK